MARQSIRTIGLSGSAEPAEPADALPRRRRPGHWLATEISATAAGRVPFI